MNQQDDMLDIGQLLKQLWDAKFGISLITLLFIGVAVIYINVTTPIYQTQSIVVPPSPAALQRYNLVARLADPSRLVANADDPEKAQEKLVKTLINDIDADDAYRAFQQVVRSQTLMQDFFVNKYLSHYHPEANALEREQLFDRFSKELLVQLPKNDKEFETAISFKSDDPALAAEWLNDYVNQALDISRNRLLNNLKVQRSEQIRAIESRIAVLRTQAETDNTNQIRRVQDALTIARGIDLAQPSGSGNLITSYTGETMYLRGYEALEAELHLLKERQNLDPYIPDLPLLQQQLRLIQSSVLPGNEFATGQVDLPAVQPYQPIAPKKALILAIAAVLGFMLACAIALVRGLWQTPQQKQSSHS